MDADFLGQAGLHAFLEAGLIFRLGWIGAGAPGVLEGRGTPETIFRPQQQAQTVARRRNGRGVRVVRSANEIETGVLDEFHVARKTTVGHGVAPAGMILVRIHPFEVKALAIEEEPLIRGPFEPAKAKAGAIGIDQRLSVKDPCRHPIQIGMARRPEAGTGHVRRVLVKGHDCARRDGLRRLDGRHNLTIAVHDS